MLLNPFISIFSTEDLFNKADELKQQWESFITDSTGSIQLQNSIRSEILNSWSRCRSIGLNPAQKQASSALNTLQLEQLLSESTLYQLAKPIIDNIYHKLAGTGYLITLNDADGKMIYLKGESDLIRKTEKMNFAPGMDWSEQAAGTNAIGTSIVTRMPIQVFSAEHFCEGFHPMTCSSSPIYHPYTKAVIGAIDLTGFWPSTQPHTLGLAVSLAQMIENQLLIYYSRKYNQLQDYYHQSNTKWSDNAIIVISDDLVVVNGYEPLLQALQLKKGSIVQNEQHIEQQLHIVNRNNVDYSLLKMQPIVINKEQLGFVYIFKQNKASSIHSKLQQLTHPLIGESLQLKTIMYKCRQIAPVDTPVLLTGETGTGKEVIARYIHEVSPRSNQPFIAINCGAISKELIGSELFGYEGGTFTGGKKEGKKGKFEEANGGTIFLDEIGEMPLDLQVHLLRVLQEKELTRLGTSKTVKLDVKVIAATNKNLELMVKEGTFRQDLFFRLNVISFKIPALRDRKEDISLLCDYYLNFFSQKYNKPTTYFLSEKTREFFLNYNWPGNIRELRNAIEHAVIFCEGCEIEKSHLPDYLATIKRSFTIPADISVGLSTLEKTELQQIKTLLEQTGWNISAVSKELNIARSTLYRKIKKYDLKEPYSTVKQAY